MNNHTPNPKSLSSIDIPRFLLSLLTIQLSVACTTLSQPMAWERISDPLTDVSVHSLWLCSSHTLFAGSSNGCIFRSTDEGSTWTRTKRGRSPVNLLDPEANRVLAFAEGTGGSIYAGTEQGELDISTDDGKTWKKVPIEPLSPDIRDIYVGSAGKILLATNNLGVLCVSQDGKEIRKLDDGLRALDALCFQARGNDLLVGTGRDGVFRSTDNGETWEAMRTGLLEYGTSYCRILKFVTSAKNEIVAVTPYRMFFLKTGDFSWTYNKDKPTFYESAARRGPNVLAMGFNASFLGELIDSNHTWRPIPIGLPVKVFKRSFAVSTRGFLLVGTYMQGVYRSWDLGRTWFQSNEGLISTHILSLFSASQGKTLYAGTLYGGLYVSEDEGGTWTNIGLATRPVVAVASRGPYIFAALAPSPLLYKPASDFVRSDDGGKSWSSFSPGLGTGVPAFMRLGRKNDIFLGTQSKGVFFSPDNGEHWEQRNKGLPDSVINGISMREDGAIVIATSNGVFRSANNGKTWIPDGLKDISCRSVLQAYGDMLIVGTEEKGIFVRRGANATWKRSNVSAINVSQLALDSKGNIIAVAGSQGFLRSTDSCRSWIPFNDEAPPAIHVTSLTVTSKGLLASSLEEGILKAVRTRGGSKDIAATPRTVKAHPSDKSLIPREMVVLTGHTDTIRSVAFSSDGKKLASGSFDNTFRIWDVVTGKLIQSIIVPGYGCLSLGFSPDGKYLLGSGQRAISVWNVDDGRTVRTIPMAFNSATAMKFSPDGAKLFTGNSVGNIQLWNPSVFNAVTSFDMRITNGNQLVELCLVDSGKTLLTLDDKGVLDVRSAETGKKITRFPRYPQHIYCVNTSPEGRIWVATSRGNGVLDIWDVVAGNIVQSIDGVPDDVVLVRFAADGDLVLTAQRDNTLKVWRVSDGSLLQTIDLQCEVKCIESAPEGHDLVTAAGTALRFWRVNWPGKTDSAAVLTERFCLPGSTVQIHSLDVNVAQHAIVYARSDKKVSLLKVLDQPTVDTWRTGPAMMEGIAFSPTKPFIATLGRDYSVTLWDAKNGAKLRVLTGASERPDRKSLDGGVAISPDGSLLASIQSDAEVKIWNLDKGIPTAVLSGQPQSVHLVAFSPDSKVLATGGSEGDVILWDARNGKRIQTFQRLYGGVHALSFSPYGRLLADAEGATPYDEIRLWDLATGTQMPRLSGTHPYTSCLAFCSDEYINIVATGHLDGSIRGWDISTGRLLYQIAAHTNSISGMVFVASGSLLVSGSEDGSLKMWDARSGAELVSCYLLGDRDWVAITPEGFFDGTRNATALIRYLKDGELLPVDQQRDVFRRPGLLRKFFDRFLKK